MKTETMIDAKGDPVPIRHVKPYDRKRDMIARRCLARWERGRELIARIYRDTAADIEWIEAMAAEGRTGARAPGKKGNFQFASFDGAIQVSRSARYELRFDERLRVAQEIIDQIIAEKAEGVDEDLAELIKGVFRPTSDGLLSQARVMGLFRLRIRHPRWAEAMDLIRESIESRRGKNLLAVRKRGATGEWESVLLDIAAVAETGGEGQA
jgi:hypothetical protein